MFNDRFKNQSSENVFAICPVPWTPTFGRGDSTDVNVIVLNERTSVVRITCNFYIYDIFGGAGPYTAGSQPYLQVSVSRDVPPNEKGSVYMAPGDSATPAHLGRQANIVCLMPANTSIIRYNVNESDLNFP